MAAHVKRSDDPANETTETKTTGSWAESSQQDTALEDQSNIVEVIKVEVIFFKCIHRIYLPYQQYPA